MCGICGLINFDQRPVQEEPIRKMMQIMKHRGPDDEGVFVNDNIGLGFVRLSIIDLSSSGNQPMISEDGRVIIIFNGEIYNYIELREELKGRGFVFRTKTDTEVLVNAYRLWGKDMLHRLNGMWAFVILDLNVKKIFGARDRYGIKPFYYHLSDQEFAFASEIPPVLSILTGKPTSDELAVFDFMVFNRTDQTERTFFKEVKKMPHGHCFSIDLTDKTKTSIRFERWYDLKSRVKEAVPFSSPVEYREILSSAVGLRLRSDVPVGVCLSGGLDSSSIVSVLLKDYQKKDLNTFSAVYDPGQHCDESAFIRLFSPELKNMYYTRPTAKTLMDDMENFLKAHAEPIPSTSPYAQYKVMELAKNHVVVTLDGQGADEELAGYDYFFSFYFKDLLKKGRMARLLSEMSHYSRIHRSLFGFKTFLYFLLPQMWRTQLRIFEKSYISKEFYQTYVNKTEIGGELYGSGSLQMALLNHFEYKLEHLLKWEDRNSMYFSLESRVPFLDYRLVERTLAMDSDLIINRGMTKYILREAMKGTLFESIRTRTDKIGFSTPQDEWFRTAEFRKYISDLINSGSFKNRPIWDYRLVGKMYQDHLNGNRNYSKEIWKWIHLENWYRKFLD